MSNLNNKQKNSILIDKQNIITQIEYQEQESLQSYNNNENDKLIDNAEETKKTNIIKMFSIISIINLYFMASLFFLPSMLLIQSFLESKTESMLDYFSIYYTFPLFSNAVESPPSNLIMWGG